MGWSKKLVDTYNCFEKYAGEEKDGLLLLPIGHSTQNAQITVELYEDGTYCFAEGIDDKDEAVTVIPVTEDSGSRSSGIAPHPLHDKFMYVAGDLSKYQKKDNTEYYKKYLEQLEEWVSWEKAHSTVKIIYEYIKKGTLIQDLIKSNILTLDEGILDEKVKIQGISQNDAFVRFRIYNPRRTLEDPWKDISLYKNYIEFYTKKMETKGLCYVTGKEIACTEKHPSKIRYSGDKAKIISSNDTSGFTFRGRVDTKEEALSIGYETSQKLHHALRWIIEKQGFQKNDMTIVAWNIKMPEIANPAEDCLAEPTEENDGNAENEQNEINTKQGYARKVNKAIEGYMRKLDDPLEDVVIMALDSATTGRLAITYYQELQGSTYYENLKNWYELCSWAQYEKKGQMGNIGTPLPAQVIDIAFGTWQGNIFKAKQNIMNSNMKRLLPCIVEGRKIPSDIVNAIYYKMIHSAASNHYQWKRLLGIFCALYRKENYDKKGVLWEMDKKENEKNGLENADYLWGCLLAVIDAIEEWALREQYGKEVPRATNAMLYFAAFQKNPLRIRRVLENKLAPYIRRLGRRANWLLEMKAEISKQLMQVTDCSLMEKNLDGRFAFGFDCQKRVIQEEIKRRREENEKNKKVVNEIVNE